MPLQLWLAYVAAVFVISGTPGPNMLLAMTHGIHHGLATTGRSSMFGLLLGVSLIISTSLGGLGAVLTAWQGGFQVLQLGGAAYLIYLGIKTWRASGAGLSVEGRPDANTGWARFRIGLLVALSNPKAILFGVVFFPQFLDKNRPFVPQASILLLTFLVIETGWMCVYAGGGAQLALWLRQGQRLRWFNRASGSAFIAAGLLLGTFHR